MQFSAITFAVLAPLALVAAQISSLPACAQTASILIDVVGSGCSTTDVKCLCSNTALINTVAASAQKSCSATDYATASTDLVSVCASQANVTVTLPATTTGSTPSTTSTLSTNAAINGKSVGGAEMIVAALAGFAAIGLALS